MRDGGGQGGGCHICGVVWLTLTLQPLAGKPKLFDPITLPALLDGLSDLSIRMADSDAWADADTYSASYKK